MPAIPFLSRRRVLAAGAATFATSVRAEAPMQVYELRQYTLHPGKRDVLIRLFEREFVESQEALGMSLPGMFRDLDDEDRFVWLRGFPDLAQRGEQLAAFYGGPVWRAHRDEANPTMVDSDNVLLLKPARPGSGFSMKGPRPPIGATRLPPGLVVATLHYLDPDAVPAFVDYFQRETKPALAAARVPVIAELVSEPGPNSFPRLPVRERDTVFVWFTAFASHAGFARYEAGVRRAHAARERASAEVLHQLARKPEVIRLAPTARSLLCRPQ
jgi:hypothetical protein